MKVTIGDMNKRLTIHTATATKNNRGVVSYTYDEIGKTVWASIRPYGSIVISGQVVKTDAVQYRIVIRYNDWVSVHDQLTYGGKKFKQTLAPQDIEEQHKYLLLTCEELI